MAPSQTDLAWAAGFLDGEGCFYAKVDSRGYADAVIQVSQRLPEALVHLQEMFGGSLHASNNKGNPVYVLNISRRSEVLNALDLLAPYLRYKADQAAVLRELVEHLVAHGQRGHSTVDQDRCKRLVELLKAQKRPWLTRGVE